MASLEQQAIQGIPLTFYGCVNFFIFNGLIVLALVSHLRASFADPGYIPKDIEVPDYIDTAKLNTCERCSMAWKPQRAHHCSECGVCIFKVSFGGEMWIYSLLLLISNPTLPPYSQMDHHCPWINNCVGQRNYKYFMQFVVLIMLASAYLCLLMALSFYFLLVDKDSKRHMRNKNYSYAFILSIVAFVEGVLFAMFTWELFSEQIESLEDN